ncbi:hypothetical protein GCM10020331_053500 [Ectobacillus funiculus]
MKSDIFGFGQAVYRANPKKWETYYKTRWYDTYPNLEVEIAPHIRVQGTGFTTKEILLPETKKMSDPLFLVFFTRIVSLVYKQRFQAKEGLHGTDIYFFQLFLQ